MLVSYRNLIYAIGESAREVYGANWELAQVASEELWRSYEKATGLTWNEVMPDVRAAWERAEVLVQYH